MLRTFISLVMVGSALVVPVRSTGMLAAMERDLGLSRTEALDRLARDAAAAQIERRLRTDLGATFAGAWLDSAGLTVATTDTGQADHIRALGAEPRIVARTESQLASVKGRLDAAPVPPTTISSWYVDVASNTVVVRARPEATAEAAAFIRASGAEPTAIRVEPSTADIVDLADLRGGIQYYNSSLESCSTGFSVTSISAPTTGGFVTAGHCGATNETTLDASFGPLGKVAGSVFPGRDHAWVQVNSGWTPRPWVNHSGGNVLVLGWREAPTGAAVCRSGYQTGWHCGTIQAKNVTTSTSSGVVIGSTRTNACADNGDSGGPFLAGQQAQGTTSRGSGDCTSGGTTYFQPLVPTLEAFHLRLVQSGSGTTPPVVISVQCERTGGFFCDLSKYHPDPVQIRWTLNGLAVPAWNDRTHVTGGCGLSGLSVRVTVSNASGSDTGSASVDCASGPR